MRSITPSGRLFLALAFAVGCASAAWMGAAQAPGPPGDVIAETAPPAFSPDFPSLDGLAWSSQRQALIARQRASRPPVPPDSFAAAYRLASESTGSGRLEGLRRIVDRHPERLGEALELLGDTWYRDAGDPVLGMEPLRELVSAATQRLPDLSPPVAARAARQLAFVESHLTLGANRSLRDRDADLAGRLDEVRHRYPATGTALQIELDLIGLDRDIARQIDRLDRFARDHAGTEPAARARYSQAFHLAHNMTRRGADPLDRFTRVADIVREIEGGPYAGAAWAERTPELLVQFQTFGASYAPGTADAMLEAYQAFIRRHLARRTGGRADDEIAFTVGSRMGDLFRERGDDDLASIDEVFRGLEDLDEPRARYLHAEVYLSRMRNDRAGRAEHLARARALLTSLQAAGSGRYHDKALAALASLEFLEGDYAAALPLYRAYVERAPDRDFAWVAALRVGRCEEYLENWTAARMAYRFAAEQYGDLPVARILGHTYAGRASEALDEPQEAAREYALALDDPFTWSRYGLSDVRAQALGDGTRDPSLVDRLDLSTRLAELERFATAGGAPVERGRWLLDTGRRREALAVLDGIVSSASDEAVRREARTLARRARIEMGLDLARADAPAVDRAAAAALFDEAMVGPYDGVVSIAAVAKATLWWIEGRTENAEELMAQALAQLDEDQRRRPATPRDAVADDVAAIRTLLFWPTGSRIYDGARLNAFRWPASPPPFALVSADVRVRLHDGDTTLRTVFQTFPSTERVLLLTTDRIALVQRIIAELGGSRRRQPTAIMETPNQPIGASLDVLAFWNRFFPIRPGHWGGWDLLTYPVVTGIDFQDEDRRHAVAHVTIGYGGCALLLERHATGWRFVRMIGQWVT